MTSDPANNSTFGTLEIRRTFTNNTGSPITKLRFRILDLTTFPAPSGFADLRARTVGALAAVANPCVGPAVDLVGTDLEQPPSQLNGGGFNSSLLANSVTMLAAGPVRIDTTSVAGTVKSRRGSVRVPTGDTIHLDATLPNGGTVKIRFLLGVQQTGTFKFFINVEALP